jgi:DNA-binding CsgD family transcriptional regulator/tetratricopeptide (TPR) repeat protein
MTALGRGGQAVVARDRGEIVGRRAELEALRAFTAGVSEGEVAFVVRGPAGIGKTTVWQAGIALAEAAGLRVLSARPSDVEARLSFAGLADLLAPVDEAYFARLPPPQRHALSVALLREEPGRGAGRRLDPRTVATATCSLLRDLALDRPTIVAIDDAQSLDAASDGVLRFAVRRLQDVPIGLLVAIRSENALPESIESAVPPERRVEATLAPLSVAALHDVVRAKLAQPVPRPALVRVAQLSGGNPLYALEIVRELVRAGAITATDRLPIPPRMQELVRRRVTRLPRSTREALLLAASLAAPTTAIVDDCALAPAEAAALVEVVDGRISFTHPLVAAAVYESASRAERRAAHRLLANRLQEGEERARHLALASDGPDESTARSLDAAAAQVAARGVSAAAADLARLALVLTPARGTDVWVERSLALAHYLTNSGGTAEALEVLQDCDAGAVRGDLRAKLLTDLGMTLWFEREFDRGYQCVVEALDHARDPDVAARTHRAAAWLSQDLDPKRAVAHDEAAMALLDPERSPGSYSWALLHAAYLRLLAGEGADDDAYRRGKTLQERNDDWNDMSPVLGIWAVFKDDFGAAREIYEAGLAQSRANGDETVTQGTLVRLTEIACWTGDWTSADAWAAEGIDVADRIGSPAFLGSALFARGYVDAHLGRAEEAQTTGERILEIFSSRDGQIALGHWVLGFLSLSLGDAPAADAQLTRAAEIVETLGHREPARFRFHPDHIEAVIQLGDLDRARTLLAAFEARAVTFPRPWILATSARCGSLLLAADGQLDDALDASRLALDHHTRLDMPFELARTLLTRAQILRRLKQKRNARMVLEEAHGIFVRLGAELWAGRAEEELRRVVARRAPADLSATERQVARLAAAGLTNKGIATEVFMTSKSVEANLTRVYRKLGIHSRAQLGRALDAEAGELIP